MAKANAKDNATHTSLHPPYFEMITDAISGLKERNGSSQQAIAKFIEEKYKKSLPSNFRKLLSVQLKKFVKSERLFKVKNSFKISPTEKLPIQIKETQEKKALKATKKSPTTAKQKAAKGMKTKRLSQVKTPDALKKDAKKKSVTSAAAKVKRLSQVKTPEGMKKKKKSNVTPQKRENSSRPNKKAGK